MNFILPLLLLPFAELYLFFFVGAKYGWPPLFLWTAITFFAGKSLIRRQNFVMSNLSGNINEIKDPLSQVLMLICGFFLMLPGLITDILGLLLLVPGFRNLLISLFKKHLDRLMQSGHLKTFTYEAPKGTSRGTGTETENMIIDVDYDIVKNVGELSHHQKP